MKKFIVPALLAIIPTAYAQSVVYNIEPTHTYPSFEADHMGGMSVWRGKFNSTKGTITVDKAAQTGSVDITVDTNSINFGLDAMNDKAKSAELFDVAKYPTATYKGKLADYQNGVPTKVLGELTLHGVTKPLDLKINSLKCMVHPFFKVDACGADAIATFNRADFGMDFGKDYGFNMNVTLRIQVEAVDAAKLPAAPAAAASTEPAKPTVLDTVKTGLTTTANTISTKVSTAATTIKKEVSAIVNPPASPATK